MFNWFNNKSNEEIKPTVSNKPVGIKIPSCKIKTETREEGPRFERTYSFHVLKNSDPNLLDDYYVEIEIKRFSGEMMYHGIVRQSNGNYVFFQPNEIADKVIDRALVPNLTSIVGDIIKYDAEWRANQTSFTDTNGNTWIKKI